MKRLLGIAIVLCGCSNTFSINNICPPNTFDTCIIYPEHGVTIQVPKDWTVIDSTRYWDKTLLYSKTFYSTDSIGEISYTVSQSNVGTKEMSTLGMETGIKEEVYAITKGKDFSVHFQIREVQNWKIASQLSYIKGTGSKFFADIYCVKENNSVSIWVKDSANSFKSGMELMNCIINSLNIEL